MKSTDKVLETMLHKTCINHRGQKLVYLHHYLCPHSPPTNLPKPILLVLAHAAGFCKDIWKTLILALQQLHPGHYISIAPDFINHGSSDKTQNNPHWFNWDDTALDLHSVIQSIDADSYSSVIGIGHSMGASALFRLDQLRPTLFRQLVLFEPVLFPKGYKDRRELSLSSLALKRKHEFESSGAALEYYSSHSFFGTWHANVLSDFVQGAFHPIDNEESSKSRVQLCCPPPIESHMYDSANTFLYSTLANGTCLQSGNGRRLDIVMGSKSEHLDFLASFVPYIGDTIGEGRNGVQFYSEICDRLGSSARLSVVEGADHFLPLREPLLFLKFIQIQT